MQNGQHAGACHPQSGPCPNSWHYASCLRCTAVVSACIAFSRDKVFACGHAVARKLHQGLLQAVLGLICVEKEAARLAVQLRNVSRTADERAVRTALEGAGLSVRSVCFDSTLDASRSRTALVRLHPPELPWQSTEEVSCHLLSQFVLLHIQCSAALHSSTPCAHCTLHAIQACAQLSRHSIAASAYCFART